MSEEPTITMTRSEFVAYTQRIQDLALMGAFVFLPGMSGGDLVKEGQEAYERLFPAYQPDDPISEGDPQILSHRGFSEDEKIRVIGCYVGGGDLNALAQSMGRSYSNISRIISTERAKHGTEKIPYRGYGKDGRRHLYAGNAGRYVAKDL